MELTTGYLAQLILLVIATTSLAGIAWTCRALRLLSARCEDLQRSLTAMRVGLESLATGNLKNGESVAELARRTRVVEQRQDRVEMRSLDERRYSEAARLVQQGADSQNLVRNCGLTSGEAELVVRLHGVRHIA